MPQTLPAAAIPRTAQRSPIKAHLGTTANSTARFAAVMAVRRIRLLVSLTRGQGRLPAWTFGPERWNQVVPSACFPHGLACWGSAPVRLFSRWAGNPKRGSDLNIYRPGSRMAAKKRQALRAMRAASALSSPASVSAAFTTPAWRSLKSIRAMDRESSATMSTSRSPVRA
jgi:hypothetical protein